jgi:DNA repair protein RecO (recombination protein O)
MAGRTHKSEAIVLRSLRYSEADRILHLYTRERGRIGAIAKGIRKTKSRFGGRLEPLSHVELMLHEGSGELQTVTGAALIASHSKTRESPYRLAAGLIGAEAMLRLFGEPEANPRAFTAVARFLDLLDETPETGAAPEIDPLVLSFQLKLLWLSGYLPHLTSCAECGAADATLVGYSPRAGGAVCGACAGQTEAIGLSPAGIRAIETLLASPLADAGTVDLSDRSARDALRLVQASYEYHGGFRLKTLSA